jgi:hypothetical protein
MSVSVQTSSSSGDRASVWGAAIIAVLAWATFVDHLWLNMERENGTFAAGLWRQMRFFTETTNIYAALLFTLIAVRWPAGATRRSLGGLALSAAVVAVVYWAVLYNSAIPRTPWNASVNVVIHAIIPAAIIAYTLTLARPSHLTWADGGRWTIYPLLYLAYAFARGHFEGRYAYFFLDPGKIGIGNVLLSVAAIIAAFATSAAALIAWSNRAGKAQQPYRSTTSR